MRQKRIRYGIDSEGFVVSQRLDTNHIACPVLDYEHMTPKNKYEIKYRLEMVDVMELALIGEWELIRWTRKIPIEIKNRHREFWGMKPLKEAENGKD